MDYRKSGSHRDTDITAEGTGLGSGFCVWLTGLPSSGKTTIANTLAAAVTSTGRYVTLLDGDWVRTHLSSELGYTKSDRDTNVRRIGFIASEIVRHNGAVVCSVVSPYEKPREEIRHLIGSPRFVLAFVDTPLEICEIRDAKGLYAKAKAGHLKGMTGIDDPFETPLEPDVVLRTANTSPDVNAAQILSVLINRGLLAQPLTVTAPEKDDPPQYRTET